MGRSSVHLVDKSMRSRSDMNPSSSRSVSKIDFKILRESAFAASRAGPCELAARLGVHQLAYLAGCSAR